MPSVDVLSVEKWHILIQHRPCLLPACCVGGKKAGGIAEAQDEFSFVNKECV